MLFETPFLNQGTIRPVFFKAFVFNGVSASHVPKHARTSDAFIKIFFYDPDHILFGHSVDIF